MTAVNDVIIANRALSKLGDARITAFDQNNKAARAVDACYEIVRDAEMRRRKWRFTLARTTLPEVTPAPEFGFGHQYQLPADCLQVIGAGDYPPGSLHYDLNNAFDTAEYSVEGRMILTDQPAPLKLRYKRRITDPALFDVCFVEALASRLAIELCEEITGSSGKKQDCRVDYKTAIGEALKANAVEAPREQMNDDAWLNARVGVNG